jgi:hypothetical protein
MVTRVSFASRRSVKREWQSSGLTRTSTTLSMVYLSLMCSCPGQSDCEDGSSLRREKVEGGAAGRATPVRPVQVWADRVLVSVLARRLSLIQVVVVLVVGMGSLQVVSLLGVLPLLLNTKMGGVVALRWRGGTTVHGLPFVAFVLLQLETVCSLVVVTVVVFVEVALIGEMLWIVLTPLWSKWLGTSFTLLVLIPVLSHLFTHVLAFEFQVGDLRNVWLIDSGCSRHMTRDKGWFSSLVPVVSRTYITFGDNGRGRVLSEGEIKVSDKVTLWCVALIQSMGSICFCVPIVG